KATLSRNNKTVPRPRILKLTPTAIRNEMARMDVDPGGIDIMEGKSCHLLIRLDDVDLRAALILKQDMLSLGGEAALSRHAAGLSVGVTPVILMGTANQFSRLREKLDIQPFGLDEIGNSLEILLRENSQERSFVVGDRDLLADNDILIVGVLNVTEDSFFDGGSFLEKETAVQRGMDMLSEGADIIDVGGESTRPGSRGIPAEQEASRVIPVIQDLAKAGVQFISVDTTKADVAMAALDAGATIVNDISGMTFDPEMPQVAADSGASVFLVHTRGSPETMQEQIEYEDLMGEVYNCLDQAVNRATGSGIIKERICVDPGIGFGKTTEQNIELIGRVGELRSLGTAVMVGASRKSFIGNILGLDVHERLEGSLAAAVASVMCGADMVRVHDVAETLKTVRIAKRVAEWKA
ncbi:MAG: dihydropteroate synthase, partial [bacterium]